MKFIVDAQLPQQLSLVLTSLGGDAIHTLDLPEKNRTGDDKIIKLAENEQRIVITKDSDFLQSHLLHNQPAKLLMVNTGNIDNPALLHLFAVNFTLLLELFKSKKYIELTKEEIIVHG
jgi:predicted nuclease of predicted toxin-antitoxin system